VLKGFRVRICICIDAEKELQVLGCGCAMADGVICTTTARHDEAEGIQGTTRSEQRLRRMRRPALRLVVSNPPKPVAVNPEAA
jgi:hypothetical protein